MHYAALFVLLALAACIMPAAAAAAAAPEPATAVSEIAVLGLSVNGERRPVMLYSVRREGRFYIDQVAFERIGLAPRDALPPVVDIEGRHYIELSAIAGVSYRVDPARQDLLLDVPPELMVGTVANFRPGTAIRPRRPDWGGFANYTVFGYADRTNGSSAGTQYLSGAGEAVLFGPYGSGTASAIVNPSVAGYGETSRFVRLDTNWRYDDIDRLQTLVVGDAVSLPGSWGRAVRYGGVQFSSNYSLQPGFITYPLQSVAGMASLPATVDVYANNQRLASQSVQGGPFSLNNVPLVSGAGELSVVVRNAFGQEQVITQPFYVAQQLLAPGLSQFALDLGSARYNYGIDNADYRGWIASGVYRRGITERLTLEGRAEGDNDVRGTGATADYLLGDVGVFTAGGGVSSGERGTGGRLLLGFSRQAQRFSINLRSTWASSDYREVGEIGPHLTRLAFGSIGTSFGRAGSLALAWARQGYDNLPDFDVGTATYTLPAGPLGQFFVSASRSTGAQDQTQLFAGFTFPLGLASGNVGYQAMRAGETRTEYGTLSLQKALPIGEGYGYRVLAQSDERFEAGGAYAGRIGRYSLDVARYGDQEAVRGSVSGGVAFLGGAAFLARPITESFGVVRTGGIAGVDVLQDNIRVGRSDEAGRVIVSRIPAYLPSKISIDPMSVPIDASIPKVNEWVTSYARTGVVVDFPLKRERNALVRLVDGEGRPLPTGTTVVVDNRATRHPVGFDGEAFLTDLEGIHQLHVDAPAARCSIDIDIRSTDGPVALLGPYVCGGNK